MTKSSLIKERVTFEGDNMVFKRTFCGNEMLKDAANAREITDHKFGGDYKHVGNVDMALLGNWLKEAGVQWTDTQGIQDVLKKKLMSNEFSGLRNWQGSW